MGRLKMLKHNDSATELLTILQEECAEVIQEASKVKRFGQEQSNISRLAKEVGDLVCMIELLQEWEVVSHSAVENSRQQKLDKLKIWSNLFSSEEERSLYYDDIVVSEN
jgi:NTP pyrophosphatase (non-canonical NTP hydrolase)|tara:strand:+ start:114 stop:440 length:327 start_codon:yes stop_codon:yes gene_type:complete